MTIRDYMEWIFESPLFVALIATILVYPFLPRCKNNNKQDRQWALRASSPVFVVVFITSIIYLNLFKKEMIHSIVKTGEMNVGTKVLNYSTGLPNF